MLVLGISDGHNSSAALYQDGQLTAALSEERLRRIKNWTGFPEQAIARCLEISGHTLADVDAVGIATVSGPYPLRTREAVVNAYRSSSDSAESFTTRLKRGTLRTLYRKPLRDAYHATSMWRTRDHQRWRSRVAPLLEMGVPEAKINVVEHHQAHASAAYYGWGKFDDDVLVLTNDGGGDDLCATVNIGREGKLKRIAQVNWSESIANLYAMTTCLLGMVPLEHEYKVMGLAPYADSTGTRHVRDDLMQLFEFDTAAGMTWHRRAGVPETYRSYRFLQKLFETRRFDGISGGLQQFTKEWTVQWVRNCIKAAGISRVALAGGLFMNVKLNKAILELPEVDELFIFPSCGDESNAIGAAYDVYSTRCDYHSVKPLKNMYLGASFETAEIERAIETFAFQHPVSVTKPDGIERAVALLLSQGHVVARFNGREEFGARALGNRSILADPSRPEVIRIINDAIKARDFWMPFAPAILDHRFHDYCVNPKNMPSPYMIICFDSTDQIGEFRAACHPYDETARPQVVCADTNPSFYRVLGEFEQLTGRGVLLNTSFNLHGFPIVSAPQDALQVFDQSGLEWLAIGDVLVHKE